MRISCTRLKKGFFILLSVQILLITGATLIREHPADDDEFTIAILPDTQYYTSEKNGGKKEMFFAQTDWIVKNAAREKIAYVIHLGDISDDGEKIPDEWVKASEAMYRLEKPQPGYPQGIPYGLAVGNHDQTKSQYPLTGKTTFYNQYFGFAHFKNKKWYGGHYRNDNDSHYDVFEAGGNMFMVIYFEYDSYDENIENLNNWASDLIEKNKDRKVILVSHSILHFNKTAGTNEKAFPRFSKQGQRIFDRMKRFPNVFMTLSGHVGNHGEGFRLDGYAGNVTKSYLTDYQSRLQGGHALMRLITFSPSKDLLSFRTFSPYTQETEKDGDSDFTMPWLHHTTVARYLDFNNDQTTELAFFKGGKWEINGQPEITLGKSGDIPVPADYNGDGKTEAAVFRAKEGKFIIQGRDEVKLGMPGDIPVCGDWDGDGFADAAVYRPSNTTWYFDGLESIKFGNKDGIPVPADYDGDGKLDVGIFNTKNSLWQTALGNIPLQVKHTPGDIPVPADYNGDGKAEMALYRPGTGEWLINFEPPFRFGESGDLPVPGNYHKGGKTDPAVYRKGKIILRDGTSIDAGKGPVKELVNLTQAVKRFIK